MKTLNASNHYISTRPNAVLIFFHFRIFISCLKLQKCFLVIFSSSFLRSHFDMLFKLFSHLFWTLTGWLQLLINPCHQKHGNMYCICCHNYILSTMWILTLDLIWRSRDPFWLSDLIYMMFYTSSWKWRDHFTFSFHQTSVVTKSSNSKVKDWQHTWKLWSKSLQYHTKI